MSTILNHICFAHMIQCYQDKGKDRLCKLDKLLSQNQSASLPSSPEFSWPEPEKRAPSLPGWELTPHCFCPGRGSSSTRQTERENLKIKLSEETVLPQEQLPTHSVVPHLWGLKAQNGTILTKSHKYHSLAGGPQCIADPPHQCPSVRRLKRSPRLLQPSCSPPFSAGGKHSTCEESCSQNTRSGSECLFQKRTMKGLVGFRLKMGLPRPHSQQQGHGQMTK